MWMAESSLCLESGEPAPEPDRLKCKTFLRLALPVEKPTLVKMMAQPMLQSDNGLPIKSNK
jgi:hypothetical protein